MNEIVLGPAALFASTPAEVEVDGRPCYVLKDGESFCVVSRKCPHAGQLVEWEDGELMCPMHGWTFDPHTGACLNIPTKGLKASRAMVKDGQLIVIMEEQGS